jgi:hypothetical protein
MYKIKFVKVEVLTATCIKLVVFWDVVLCSLVNHYSGDGDSNLL